MDDGDPPPDHELGLLHAVSYEIQFSGSHVLQAGDVARFMPASSGTCAGAALASSSFGGALDGALSVSVQIGSDAPDGSPGAAYALCLAEGPTLPLSDEQFVLHSHVRVVISHEPPSMPPPLPPPPSPPPPSPPPPGPPPPSLSLIHI